MYIYIIADLFHKRIDEDKSGNVLERKLKLSKLMSIKIKNLNAKKRTKKTKDPVANPLPQLFVAAAKANPPPRTSAGAAIAIPKPGTSTAAAKASPQPGPSSSSYS